MVKTVSSVGAATSAVETHLQELEADGLLRIHEQVVHADRQAVDEEQDEGEPPHRVRVEPPAGRLRRHGVEGDIGREEPEIDDRVQRPREQRARQSDVDGRGSSRSAAGMTWNRSSTATPTVVHSHITALATVANMASGTGTPGLSRLKPTHGEDHQPAPDPRPDHHQHEADVEIGARGHRRIEGEEHGRRAARDRRRRHSDADDAERRSRPRRASDRAADA